MTTAQINDITIIADNGGGPRDQGLEKKMAITIYFPSIDAEATADVTRGGTASVCHSWDGNAYIGKINRVKFTTVKPKRWNERMPTVLKHIPDGGFCYEFVE